MEEHTHTTQEQQSGHAVVSEKHHLIQVYMVLVTWLNIGQKSTREENGNPLQCSCLENPRYGGAWWAASVGSHRVGHDWSDLAAAAAARPSHMYAGHFCRPEIQGSAKMPEDPREWLAPSLPGGLGLNAVLWSEHDLGDRETAGGLDLPAMPYDRSNTF